MTDDAPAAVLHWTGRGLISAVLVLAGTFLAAAVVYPYQTSYVEGFMLDQARRVATGGGLYRDLADGPWIIDNFPPLYLWLLGGLYAVAGASFLPGRLLTSAAVAALAVLAWRWNRRLGARKELAWGAVSLWVAGPYVLRRAMLLRMDFAAILLAALGIWLYMRRTGRWVMPAAAALFLAALLIRQTMVAAPGALLIGLWSQRRRREALVLAATLGVSGLAAVGLLQAAYPHFLEHVLWSNLGPWDAEMFLHRWGALIQWHAPLLVAGVIGAWALRRDDGLAPRVVLTWAVLAALASLTVGKPGSSSNHFLELLFVAACLSGAGIEAAARRISSKAPRVAAPTGILIVALVTQVAIAAVSAPLHDGLDALQQRDEDARLVALLADADGPVLSENAGAAVQAGHELVLEPRTFHELHAAGAWDDAGLVQRIATGTYDIIVIEAFPPGDARTTGFRFTPDAWDALQGNYTHAKDIGRWQVWLPEVA